MTQESMDVDAFRRAQGLPVKHTEPKRAKTPKPPKEPSSLELRLPFPPSVNHYWRRNGNTVFISKAGKSFRVNVAAAVLDQLGKPKPLEGSLRVEMVLHRGDRRVCDIDNYAKSTLDALAHAGVFVNDSQVNYLAIVRGEVCKPGSMLVVIKEY